MTAGSGRRGLLISRGWVQAVVLVVLFGFFNFPTPQVALSSKTPIDPVQTGYRKVKRGKR